MLWGLRTLPWEDLFWGRPASSQAGASSPLAAEASSPLAASFLAGAVACLLVVGADFLLAGVASHAAEEADFRPWEEEVRAVEAVGFLLEEVAFHQEAEGALHLVAEGESRLEEGVRCALEVAVKTQWTAEVVIHQAVAEAILLAVVEDFLVEAADFLVEPKEWILKEVAVSAVASLLGVVSQEV